MPGKLGQVLARQCGMLINGLQVKSKLGTEDVERITQQAVAAAQATVQQALQAGPAKDRSPAGASRYRSVPPSGMAAPTILCSLRHLGH